MWNKTRSKDKRSDIMKIIGIEHIGIAVKNLDRDSKFWNEILGINLSSTEDVDDQGVKTDIYDTGSGKIELLLSKYPNSPIDKFIQKRGPGIHHICLEVENIDDAIKFMLKNDIKLIGDEPTIGAEGYRVIFIHPTSAGGVLVELAEKPA